MSKLISEIIDNNYDLDEISRTASKKVRENNLIDDIANKYYQDYKTFAINLVHLNISLIHKVSKFSVH